MSSEEVRKVAEDTDLEHEDEESITIIGEGGPSTPLSPSSESEDVDDDTPIEITTESEPPTGGGSGYYTPPGKTVGIFSDDFNGNGSFPNRGKWIKYVGRNGWTGGGYGLKDLLVAEGALIVFVGGIGEGEGIVNLGVLSRAEFKAPFKTTFQVSTPNDELSNGDKKFEFALIDPNPPDHIYSTHLYGVARLLIYAEENEGALDWFYQLWGEAPVGLYSGLPFGEVETITVEQTITAFPYVYVTIRLSREGELGSSETDPLAILPSKSGTYRIGFNCECGESENIRGFYVHDVKVEREKNRIARHIVTIENSNEDQYAEFYNVSQDVVSIKVAEREGSCLSLAMTLNAPIVKTLAEEGPQRYGRDARYWTTKQLRISNEVEVRAGWDYMMWLLFRGDIDELEFDQPNRTMEVVSSQGFGKLLDWRETNEENYSGDADQIILDLIDEHYDDETELSADWIYEGDGLSIASDDEAVSSIIQKLVDLNEYVSFIDFNRSLVFWPVYTLSVPYYMGFSDEMGTLGTFKENQSDTVINDITVKGASDTYQAEDLESISSYGRRQKTFTDESLTDLGSVTSRAESLLKLYAYPRVEYDIEAPENYLVCLYDLLWWETYVDVANGDDFTVKSVEHTYTPGNGLRTKVEGDKTKFRLSDILTTPNIDWLTDYEPPI